MTTETSLDRSALRVGEVHVLPLLIGAGTAAELAPLLTPDEKKRAERYNDAWVDELHQTRQSTLFSGAITFE